MKQFLAGLFMLLATSASSQTDLTKNIVETWNTHCEMNYYLLDSVAENNLKDTLCSGGRNVLQQFLHLNETRLLWIKQLTGIDIKNLQPAKNATRSEVSAALHATDQLIRDFIEKNISVAIKGFGGNTVSFMGYLIAHEAHGRGQIVLAYKQSGHKLPPKIQYGIWKWD